MGSGAPGTVADWTKETSPPSASLSAGIDQQRGPFLGQEHDLLALQLHLGSHFGRIEPSPSRLLARGAGGGGVGSGRVWPTASGGRCCRGTTRTGPAATAAPGIGLGRVGQHKQLGIGLAVRQRLPASSDLADRARQARSPL